MKLGAALMQAQALIAVNSDSPRLDAELLLAHVLGLSRTQLRMRAEQRLAEAEAAQLAALVQRRCDGEPIAYLTGSQGFWSLDLQVTPAVLVPRPETELLVEWALELLPAAATSRVADLGTGSGAIALAIAVERPGAQLSASDVSAAALAVARSNAERVQRVIDFREGSWWQAFGAARFDLLVSNPPYIAAGDEHLTALRHEPLLALSDGSDGLQALREIISGAPAHLAEQGWLLVEHGHDQGTAVRALLAAAGLVDINTRRDLEGRERVSGGRKP